MESYLDRVLAGAGSAPAAVPAAGRGQAAAGAAGPGATADAAAADGGPAVPQGPAAPRIAIYDTMTSPPRVIPVEEEDVPALIASLAEKTYSYCREQGGQVPYAVILELIENLLHACFQDVVITILDNGQTIRISDHGPGVPDKERAFQPGFTTATAWHRRFIRGVGSGLPLARESLQFLRGVLTVEDNLGGGAVFTIRLPRSGETQAPPPPPPVKLTNRQTRVLALLMELGAAGPTAVARELKIATTTAYRELSTLEKAGLVHSVGEGKRALTDEGLRLLESIL